MDAPRFAIAAIELFERPVVLRLPFRFGVVTLTRAPQAFVRVRIRVGGRESSGAAAELLAPKWFDKNLTLSNDDNFDQLRDSCHAARGLYLDGESRTAFDHFIAHYAAQIEACADKRLNPLVAGFGPALIDRAVLDALCRLEEAPFAAGMQRNIAGLVADPLVRDLAGFDIAGFLARRRPARAIDARHTVGLVDPITAADQATRVGDGLPETLAEVVATYRHRWYKLKVGGDVAADLARLTRIAAVLDASGIVYGASLDGNEQYDDIDAVIALWRKMGETPALARLVKAIAFIEQPVNRKTALARDVSALSALKPVIIDESDDTLGAFPIAKGLGYRGVSSKTCKGLYKSILNAARCESWGAGYFMSGEDLTTQAGLAVQQDLALVAFLGLAHVERNGHHYVDGFHGAPRAEADAFLAAHPTLYHRASGHRSAGGVRLRIAGGALDLSSFDRPGFAAGAEPDWASLAAMPCPNRLY